MADFHPRLVRHLRGYFSTHKPLGVASEKSRKIFPRTVLEKLSESVRVASRLNQAICDFPCFFKQIAGFGCPASGVLDLRFHCQISSA
jgi:hypothetical protein